MSNLVPVHDYAVSDIEKMARAFAVSKLFGVQTPEQALALCLIAQAEGRHPASAANDYHIVSGRPSKKAEAMLRDFIGAGGKVEWHVLDDAQADATFSHPGGGSVRIQWDMKRKTQAGINNPMWAKYPRQMLRSRCISEGVRTVYPAATSGMYEPEETREFAPEPPRNVTPLRPEPVLAPKAAKAHRALTASRKVESAEAPTTLEADDAPDTDHPEIVADVSGAASDYADELEFKFDTETDRSALIDTFNATIKTAEWKAFKSADPGRAEGIKAKVAERAKELA